MKTSRPPDRSLVVMAGEMEGIIVSIHAELGMPGFGNALLGSLSPGAESGPDSAFEAEFADLAGDTGDDTDWHGKALCAQTDPEAFFPEKGGSTRDAKKICTGCEVRAECLSYALANDERFGIWGGLSERERRRLKRLAS